VQWQYALQLPSDTLSMVPPSLSFSSRCSFSQTFHLLGGGEQMQQLEEVDDEEAVDPYYDDYDDETPSNKQVLKKKPTIAKKKKKTKVSYKLLTSTKSSSSGGDGGGSSESKSEITIETIARALQSSDTAIIGRPTIDSRASHDYHQVSATIMNIRSE
jgi:hypothetical protein